MKIKHNKKRNTYFLYEALVRELTRSVIDKEKDKEKISFLLLKKYFSPNSELGKQRLLMKEVIECQDLNKDDLKRVLEHVYKTFSSFDDTKIFDEQSKLINDINQNLGKSVFQHYVPNFRYLATIDKIFDKKTPIKQKVLLENALYDEFQQAQEKEKTEDSEDDDYENVSEAVLRLFVKKLNEKYSTQLLEEQKKVLVGYLNLIDTNSIEYKMYINEEISRLKTVIGKALNEEAIKGDETTHKKLQKVMEILHSFHSKIVDKDTLKEILGIQELAREILND
jgi:hypothetical protein